ncbi:hypothetical protein LG204_06110 [Methylovorus menthalis]|uniref:hypothetical protein n=1 Tax=Methylovorus menthalis TaxID=1002227 RepID=UPI001E4EEA05|nr:hypothetical protein [Methylovorus menthalis]MCB4810885.1 hypothetical protein [Methylovorus menthalis]
MSDYLNKLKSLVKRLQPYVEIDGEALVFEEDLILIQRALSAAEESHLDSSEDQAEIAKKLPEGFFDNPLVITGKDVVGLPQEVLDELNDLDSLETEILEIFELAKGPVIIDKIIAGLYHLTGVKHTRSGITAKLYRMAKKKLIYSVPRKKGVYSLEDTNDEL